MDKENVINYTLEDYSVLKKNDIMKFAETCKKLEKSS